MDPIGLIDNKNCGPVFLDRLVQVVFEYVSLWTAWGDLKVCVLLIGVRSSVPKWMRLHFELKCGIFLRLEYSLKGDCRLPL